jgi:general secretion pathway protein A
MSETYYGEFYGFRSAPFHITPDPSLLFQTETHQTALGAMEYGINAGKGFIVVSGQVGVGKTTVLRACLDRLDLSKNKIIYLYNPALTTVELYNTILDELDPTLRPSIDPADTFRTLQRTLLETHQAGRQVILAVDEAQNMPEETLESLRILSNLESAGTKLLQIILVGQPELETKLKKHSLRQLNQRVAVRARIKRLTFGESYRYIEHRTRCAGRRVARTLFTRPAQWYIGFAARGTPRTINICCDNALINGYAYSAERITLPIAREACSSLGYRAPIRGAIALAGALVVLFCGIFFRDTLVERFHAPTAGDRAALQTALPNQNHAVSGPGATEAPAPPAVAHAPNTAPAAVAQAPSTGASLEELPRVTQRETQSTNSARLSRGKPQEPASRSRWLVRKGDSVIKACRATYGSCDERTLRAVLAHNPQIGPEAIIYEGDVLIMPETIGPLRAKRKSL